MSCALHMQGACDPAKKRNAHCVECIKAHNNIVSLSESLIMFHDKVSDYFALVLRPLYEFHDDVHMIERDLMHSGARAAVSFPNLYVEGKQSLVDITECRRNYVDCEQSVDGGRHHKVSPC